MQPLDAMRGRIEETSASDVARGRAADTGRAAAETLAGSLPLTHRTVTSGGPTLLEILESKSLLATRPCTEREVECGIDRAVYFFLGCAAYPDGAVTFLVAQDVLQRVRGSFSPFDSGSLSDHARPSDPGAGWDEADKQAFLALHLGPGTDAVSFCGTYMAAHFHDPTDYVRFGQQSVPDFPAYHGLASGCEDRRAWSIEVRLHADVELNDENTEAIVIGSSDLLVDFDDDLFGKVVVAEDEGSITSMVQRMIVGSKST